MCRLFHPASLVAIPLSLMCLAVSPAPTLAATPPFQQVEVAPKQTWESWRHQYQYQLTYRVWAPDRNQWVSRTTPQYDGMPWVTVSHGVVAWISQRYDRVKQWTFDTMHVAVYDPGAGGWQEKEYPESWGIRSIANAYGTVSWVTQRWDSVRFWTFNAVQYTSYDPVRNGWVDDRSREFWNVDKLVGGDSQVIWAGSDFSTPGYRVVSEVGYAAFVKGGWRSEAVGTGTAAIQSIGITAGGTSVWQAGGTNYQRGLDSRGNWYAGVTQPQSIFSLSRTSGTRPFTAYLWDSSLGGTRWSSNLGDGRTLSGRTPTVTYSKSGTYTFTQTVFGQTGSASSSVKITVR